MDPVGIAILGATGLVGQRLVQLLSGHPWFRIRALCASDRCVGQRYGEVTRWLLPGAPPVDAATTVVRPCEPGAAAGCALAFSALDAAVAREIEREFADAGFAVVSNSSAYRHDPAVPLLVPEINAAHLGVIAPDSGTPHGGFIVTNPNCSTTGLALAMAPLHRAFGVRRVVVTTLQAASGAGANGPRALELLDNVVPYIEGEEAKIERELDRILGRLSGGLVQPAGIAVSAHCHRVPVVDGHLEAVSVETARPANPDDVREALERFRPDIDGLALPSAPERTLVLRDEDDRPQPRLDRDCGGGMSAVIGRIRKCPVLGIKLELLSHNTIRGAAGGTLLNAELLVARGWTAGRGGS